MTTLPPPRLDPALADLFVPERTPEIAFWSELARGYGRVLVNWHCGGGELALGLAGRGLRVVGIDPEPSLIEVAQARERKLLASDPGAGLIITWLAREPRLISLPGPADTILISDNALGLYATDEAVLGLLTNALFHLRPGGMLGLTLPLAPASGTVPTTALSGPLRPLPPGFFARRVSTLSYDPATRRLSYSAEVLVRRPDGEQSFEDSGSRRLFMPAEIVALLRTAGFIGIGMWGGWNRQSVREASGSFIVRAERSTERVAGMAEEG